MAGRRRGNPNVRDVTGGGPRGAPNVVVTSRAGNSNIHGVVRSESLRSTPARPSSRPVVLGELLHPLLPDVGEYDLDVSVVFGTYNRRALLQACVGSIHRACAPYRYEIVISDGGSTDGTAEWLRGQPNVVVLPGDLSGAVNAFNAAARVAKGRFIVCLNDDAALEESAIVNALAYFDDPMVGQVAMSFYEGGVWKVLDALGKTYGNFPVTRANIVRVVESIVGGMWATCYRTYGGDNELSCWVHRLGYKVVPAHNARLRHREHVDQLRRTNVATDTARGQFHVRWPTPEHLRFRGPRPQLLARELVELARVEAGESLAQRWSRIPALDPKPGEFPPTSVFDQERVLHWHLRTDDDPQKSMVDALTAVGTRGHLRVDWTYTKEGERARVFEESTATVKPTLIFMQLQAADALPVAALRTLCAAKDRDPSLVVCAWSGDVGPTKGPWPGMHDDWQYEIAKHVDLMLFTGTGQVQLHRSRGMANACYLQIGYDVDRYYPGPDERYGTKHSIVFVGQDYGRRFDAIPSNDAELRRSVVKSMRALPGSMAYGGGFGSQLRQSMAGDVYRSSAAAISVSVTSKLGRYTSDRMIRSMACGCPTFVKRFDDMEGLGLEDTANCIVWDTVGELVDKARFWLDPSRRADLRAVGRAGAELMRTQHTWAHRMSELAALVAAVRGYKG